MRLNVRLCACCITILEAGSAFSSSAECTGVCVYRLFCIFYLARRLFNISSVLVNWFGKKKKKENPGWVFFFYYLFIYLFFQLQGSGDDQLHGTFWLFKCIFFLSFQTLYHILTYTNVITSASAYSHIFFCFLHRDVDPSLRPLITWLEETVYCAVEGDRNPSTGAASDMSFCAISWGTARVRKGQTAAWEPRTFSICVCSSLFSHTNMDSYTCLSTFGPVCLVVCFP